MKLKTTRREDAKTYKLPGRDWLHYSGPEVDGAKNLTVGYAIFPPGSAPEGHVHPAQEEVIYIISGSGELVTPDGTTALEPGTVVYIPIGVYHSTVCHGPEPMEMVTSFSPPVVPGSYIKKD